MAITFQNLGIEFRLAEKTRLKSWVRKVLRQEGKKEGEVNFVFTNDERLHEMNLEYLGHDTYTDIITFDQTEGLKVSGDIVISKQRVDENAGSYGVSPPEELRRVMIHGVLHLCGYKDKTDSEKKLMRSREDESLALFTALGNTTDPRS